jgi:NAD(P)-dependent dehydrogenase (short-subunit alcohol dehydrogenase family)
MEFENRSMTGKICLVTGATSGIGKATALSLANHAATVVIAGRSEDKCKATVQWVIDRTQNRFVDFLVADLSDQAQVRSLAAEFKKRYDRLHVLVNNAGARFMTYQKTKQGLEMTFALNHLAYFLLTELLLEVLRAGAPARIINIASGSQTIDLDFGNLTRWHSYDGRKAYAQSKFANMLFSSELARRLDGSGVTVNAVNPGGVATNFNKNNGWLYWLRHVLAHIKAGNLVGPATAAETIVYLAASPEVASITGKYFYRKEMIPASEATQDQELARRLWEISCELSGVDTLEFDVSAEPKGFHHKDTKAPRCTKGS